LLILTQLNYFGRIYLLHRSKFFGYASPFSILSFLSRIHKNHWLEFLNGQPVYTFDDNGNLLNSDTLTNRLVSSTRDNSTIGSLA